MRSSNHIRFAVVGFLCLGIIGFAQTAFAQVSSPAPYVSQLREACIEEMTKDPEIRVACMSHYSDTYHAADAKQIATNNKHVFAAYAVIWALITVFLVSMWLRQRSFRVQIAELKLELQNAMKD